MPPKTSISKPFKTQNSHVPTKTTFTLVELTKYDNRRMSPECGRSSEGSTSFPFSMAVPLAPFVVEILMSLPRFLNSAFVFTATGKAELRFGRDDTSNGRCLTLSIAESATSTAISSKVRETGGAERVRGSLTSAERP